MRKVSIACKLVGAIVVCFIVSPALAVTVLHSFGGGANGGSPFGKVTLVGSDFYGMTWGGGSSNLGTIYKIGIDGTNFSVLHEFAGGAGDGANPYGHFTQVGGSLYGITQAGGTSGNGTVFKIDVGGGAFSVLREFEGFTASPTDGWSPFGSPEADGITLYSTTRSGGAHNRGTVFKIDTDGSGYQRIYEFTPAASDGVNPYSSPVLIGSTLYGMTRDGGAFGDGTVYKVNTDGTGFQQLHSFAGGAADGESPWVNGLAFDGSTLFGMTREGGANSEGTIFRIDTDGSNYQVLHNFTGDGTGLGQARGTLTVVGSKLYGMTWDGGDFGNGLLFQINKDGSRYHVRHHFEGYPGDGRLPLYGALVPINGNFYGVTSSGGTSNQGVIFSIPILAEFEAELVTGSNVAASTSGGSSTTGGVDAIFSNVTQQGVFTAIYDPIPIAELTPESLQEINFLLPSDPLQVWDLTFDGTFSGPVTLTLGYDDSNLLAPEESIAIYHRLPSGVFELLPTISHDLLGNTITVQTSSFSLFFLGVNSAVVPEPDSITIWTLLALALAGFCFYRSQRKK